MNLSLSRKEEVVDRIHGIHRIKCGDPEELPEYLLEELVGDLDLDARLSRQRRKR